MPLPREAYLASMSDIRGWFWPEDIALFQALDGMQRDLGVHGDLLEIGVFHGKSAVMLGYLRQPDERLFLCDTFGGSHANEDNQREVSTRYPDFSREDFERTWSRFHEYRPVVFGCESTLLTPDDFPGPVRLAHVDGSHLYEVVRSDIALVQALLGDSGVVVFDDYARPHTPGVAAAAWEEAVTGGLRPLWLTESKFYGTWDPSRPAPQDILSHLQPDDGVEWEEVPLLGQRLLRFMRQPRPAPAHAATPPPEPVPAPGDGRLAPWLPEPARAALKAVTPPLVVNAARAGRERLDRRKRGADAPPPGPGMEARG